MDGREEFGTSALVAAVVALGVVVAAAAVWHARTVVLLLFLSYTFAAAARPGVEALRRRRVPRALAVGAHLVGVAGAIGLLLWLLVPTALEQTQAALGSVASGGADRGSFADGVARNALSALEAQLREVPGPAALTDLALRALGVLAGIAFTLVCSVYWLAERDRLVRVVLVLLPRERRETVRDAWLLVDLRLGAVIRTKLLLVAMTGSILSLAFWLIGLPFFVLVGVFAGLVEVLPVIGPLAAGIAAVGAGLTESWQLAAQAAAVVYGLRVLQDYVINPRLFGRAVDLPPLVVLLAVSALAIVLGAVWVPLAIPIAAVLSTLADVLVWGRDPGEERVPSVLLRTRESVRQRLAGRWVGRRPRFRRNDA